MTEPGLKEIAKVICCPKRSKRCTGECDVAEQEYFAAATAVQHLYRQQQPAEKES